MFFYAADMLLLDALFVDVERFHGKLNARLCAPQKDRSPSLNYSGAPPPPTRNKTST
jgi:hypothetical protein